MTKKEKLFKFLKRVSNRKLMTKFLINIFDYDGLEDYNYISRISMKDDSVILDVYDNVTENRFNRYCFNFIKSDKAFDTRERDNVFVTEINILSLTDTDNKLLKFAYLFKMLDIEYAKAFLDKEIVGILTNSIT